MLNHAILISTTPRKFELHNFIYKSPVFIIRILIMKNLFYVTLAMMLMTSCGDDNKSDTKDRDSIIQNRLRNMQGLHVILPKKNNDENQEPPQVKENNIMKVILDKQDKIKVTAGEFNCKEIGMKYGLPKDSLTGEYIVELEHLRQIAKDFISNKSKSEKYPAMTNVSYTFKEYDDDGKFVKEHRLPSGKQYSIAEKHVISLTTDRGTSYSMYFKVLNELYVAYNELRDEMSINEYGKKFSELEPGEKGLINMYYMYRIFEAEPTIDE